MNKNDIIKTIEKTNRGSFSCFHYENIAAFSGSSSMKYTISELYVLPSINPLLPLVLGLLSQSKILWFDVFWV